ncbi:MAG: hypothetical protein ABJN75_01280 [Hoeflea sp.]|uniref:hypothetical protein n=1 Tax=Hoeflea sp. TaxID=1940281 RepID=UPI003296B4FC
MHMSPKILVVTDEPMLTVNLLSELEDRGFAVEPMKPREHRNCAHSGIDAAIFDLHQSDEMSLRFAYKLLRSATPIITLGGGSSFNSLRIAGAQTCLSRPVDYDRLADLLFNLVSQPLAITPRAGAGVLQQPAAMSADER